MGSEFQTGAHIVLDVAALLGRDAHGWLEPAYFDPAVGDGNPADQR